MNRVRLYLVLVVLLCAVFFGVFTWLGNVLYPAVASLDIAGEQARFGITKFFAHWRAVDELYRRYDQCLVDRTALESFNVTSALLTKENNELKELVGFVEHQRLNIITARVYGHGISGEHQAFFDGGTEDGVVVKYPVLGTSGNIVGLVSDAQKQRSVITFLSSPTLALPVITTKSKKAIGVTQGGRSNEVAIGFIPQQFFLSSNEEILMPPEATVLQREFYVGRVDSVTHNASDIFQSAVVILPEPFGMISQASVVTP